MRILYDILNFLYQSEAKSKLIALTLKDIQKDLLKDDGSRYSERTIYNRLTELEKAGYVKNGLRSGNANTFYISAEGIKWMAEIEREEDEQRGEVTDGE